MPVKSKTSARKRILEVLDPDRPGDDFMTAAEIKRKIPECSLRTISSTLAKMAKKRVITRQKGVGPRGGYGYRRELTITEIIEANSMKLIREEIDKQFLNMIMPYTFVSKKV